MRDLPDDLEGVAFLLTVIGQDILERSAKHLASLDVKLAHVAVLYEIGREPGQSQQAVSERLEVTPGQLVGYLDHLEAAGYLERRRERGDRRRNALAITDTGTALLADLARHASEYQQQLGLDAEQIAVLHQHLAAVARHRRLLPPGARKPAR